MVAQKGCQAHPVESPIVIDIKFRELRRKLRAWKTRHLHLPHYQRNHYHYSSYKDSHHYQIHPTEWNYSPCLCIAMILCSQVYFFN